MARTELTAAVVPNTNPGGEVEYLWEVADIVNQNAMGMSGREVLLIKNTGVVSRDVTIDSVPDTFGRIGDLTVSVPAGEERTLAFLNRAGWMQGDGTLYLDCPSTDISYAVLRLPTRPA